MATTNNRVPVRTPMFDKNGRMDRIWELFFQGLASAANITLTAGFLGGRAVVGEAYSASIIAVGGEAPYTYSLSTGALPAGLMLDASTGAISGTPTAPGAVSFTIEVTDAASNVATADATINVASSLSLSFPGPITGVIGIGYSGALLADGGTPPYTAYAITDGALPDGLSLDASTGIISGTPTTAATSTFTAQVTDNSGATATVPCSITISPAVSLSLVYLGLDPVVGVFYSGQLVATAGVAPYTFSIDTGTLPTGLSLDSSTGKITGTPSATGTSSFTAKVTDSASNTATTPVTLNVVSASSVPYAPLPTTFSVVAGYGLYGNEQRLVLSGAYLFNTSDPNYAQDVRLDVTVTDPDGNTYPVISILGNPIGVTGRWNNLQGPVIFQPSSSGTWTAIVTMYNTAGVPNPSTLTYPLSIHPAVITSVTGAEVGPIYQDPNQGLHTVMALTPNVANSQYPIVITFWVDFGDGRGPIWQGWNTFPRAGISWRIGDPTADSAGATQAGTIWVPTDPTHDVWTVYAAPNAINANISPTDPSISGSVVSSSFTVSVAAACSPNDCTNIHFLNNPDTGDPVDYVSIGNDQWEWHFYELDWTQPRQDFDPFYQYSMATIQKGYLLLSTCAISTVGSVSTLWDATQNFLTMDGLEVGNVIHVAGVWNLVASIVDATHLTLQNVATNGAHSYDLWNPAPDWEGVNAEEDLLWYGRGPIGDSGDPNGGPEVLGSTVKLNDTGAIEWGFPPDYLADGVTVNPYRTYKFEVYAVSRLGQDPNGGPQGGTFTRQNGWPAAGSGGADAGYLTISSQPGNLDLGRSSSASYGAGMQLPSGGGGRRTLQTKNAGGLTHDVSGNNVAQTGATGTSPAGVTLGVNAAGELVFNNADVTAGLPPATSYATGAVIIDSLDNYMPYRLNGTTWVKSTDPVALVAGAIASGVTLIANQVTAGTLTGSRLVLVLSNVTTSVDVVNQGVYGFAGFSCVDNIGHFQTFITPTAVVLNNNTTAGPNIALECSASQAQLTATTPSGGGGAPLFNLFVNQSSQEAELFLSWGSREITLTVGATGVSVVINGLPSSNPGTGTKQLWYDPTDSNRVKFAA